ncbi:MAG: hypothetical protein ACP5E4_04830, partial [Candidatus Aenigmatarchaeota archaeon]
IYSVAIGDAVSDYEGNEIIAGSNEPKVYTFSRNGTKIWDFVTQTYVHSVALGNATADLGNEVAAGDGHLYIFNFDYFPTNLSIDVGGDGSKEWNSSSTKLRNSEEAFGAGITSAINDYLANNCTPDASENCLVPLVFHSDFKGKLNISDIQVGYSYNLSGIFSRSVSYNWSRTSNVSAGEPVGSSVYKLSFFETPSENVTLIYVTINQSATKCDFNGTNRPVATVGGQKVCNLSSTPFIFTANQSINASENEYLLWDDTMPLQVPITIDNTSGYYSLDGAPENYTRQINLTLYAINGTFTSVTANWTVNDTQIKGEAFVKVFDGGACDITPNVFQNDCDSDAPSYTFQKNCSAYSFYSCKKALGGATYFKWMQSELSSGTNVTYQAGGAYNLRPSLSNMSVSPDPAIWGENLTFSVDVSDNEGDSINLSLWVKNQTGWTLLESKTSGGGTVEFNVTSDKN